MFSSVLLAVLTAVLFVGCARMVYADFWYPNKDGVGARAILVRKIHIVPKGE